MRYAMREEKKHQGKYHLRTVYFCVISNQAAILSNYAGCVSENALFMSIWMHKMPSNKLHNTIEAILFQGKSLISIIVIQ